MLKATEHNRGDDPSSLTRSHAERGHHRGHNSPVRLSHWLLSTAVCLGGCAIAPEQTDSRVQVDQRSPLKEPPGVYFSEVTQETIGVTICVTGWTATVRPSTTFTGGLKRLMLSRAGLLPSDAAKFELDHFIPLALGGHPRAEDNLWLQPWDGTWSAKIKDRLENPTPIPTPPKPNQPPDTAIHEK